MTDSTNVRAQVLKEALPYFQRYRGEPVVVKYGGHAMSSRDLKESFAGDMVLLEQARVNPVVVHGGGPQIGEMLSALGIESRFHDGLRITDATTMDVVEMVLAGSINKEIVARVARHGGRAVGLTGRDGGLIRAHKMAAQPSVTTPELIDLGRVGEVESVDPTILRTLISDEFIPVIAPVAYGPGGIPLNINADVVAECVSTQLAAKRLLLMTDVDGVRDGEGTLIPELSASEADEMILSGIITGGMIPKVRCALRAARGGVEKVTILNGTIPNAVILELFTDEGVGTVITA